MATKKPTHPKKSTSAAPTLANLPLDASSASSYAILAQHAGLMLHGQTARDEDKKIIYSLDGTDVASLQLVGGDIVIEFLAPPDLDIAIDGPRTLRDFLHHFEAVADRPGWLRYRRIANRDPRPGLDARLGAMLGQSARQRLGK